MNSTTKGSPYLIIIIIAVFGTVIAVLIYSAIRRREVSFEGEVIDKNIIETRQINNMQPGVNNGNGINLGNMQGNVTHTYKIKVKDNSGKVINYKVSQGKYEIIEIGDRVSKPKGTTDVTILDSSKTNNPAS
jgi:nitrogen fixation protein FixH